MRRAAKPGGLHPTRARRQTVRRQQDGGLRRRPLTAQSATGRAANGRGGCCAGGCCRQLVLDHAAARWLSRPQPHKPPARLRARDFTPLGAAQAARRCSGHRAHGPLFASIERETKGNNGWWPSVLPQMPPAPLRRCTHLGRADVVELHLGPVLALGRAVEHIHLRVASHVGWVLGFCV